MYKKLIIINSYIPKYFRTLLNTINIYFCLASFNMNLIVCNLINKPQLIFLCINFYLF